MSAAESAEAFVGMLSTTDSLQMGEIGMYLMHFLNGTNYKNREVLPRDRMEAEGRRVEQSLLQ